jgi:hypothetical protein
LGGSRTVNNYRIRYLSLLRAVVVTTVSRDLRSAQYQHRRISISDDRRLSARVAHFHHIIPRSLVPNQ